MEIKDIILSRSGSVYMSRFRRKVETSYSADIIGFTTRLCIMGMLTKLFKTIDGL